MARLQYLKFDIICTAYRLRFSENVGFYRVRSMEALKLDIGKRFDIPVSLQHIGQARAALLLVSNVGLVNIMVR